jgi:hypothetical protein
MAEPSLQLGNGNWAGKSSNLLAYHKVDTNFYADELTFTRASTGTIVNSDGLIEQVPYNLLTYSEEFNNAIWVKNLSTITPNAITSPNGTLDASKIESTATSPNSRIEIFPIINDNSIYTSSIFVKKGSLDFFSVNVRDKSGTTRIAYFDINNGTVSSTVNSPLSSNIESFGDYYRLSVSIDSLSGATSVRCQFVLATSDGNVNVLLGDYVYIYGAQVNSGSTAKTYYPTTTRLNVPRIDYLNNAKGSLLLESQRTNLVTYSQDFSNAAWTKTSVTAFANNTTSPDGTINAYKIEETAVFNNHRVFDVISTSVATHVASVFAKAGTRNKIAIRETNDGTALFDLDNISVISGNGLIEDYGNGWRKCSLIYNQADTVAVIQILIINDSNAQDYLGEVGKYLYIWGADLQLGSYPTSYIPTSGTSVTRIADASILTNSTALPTSYPFSVVGEFTPLNTVDPQHLFSFLDNTLSTNFFSVFFITDKFGVSRRNPTINRTSYTSSIYSPNNSYNIGLTLENSTSVLLVINGVTAIDITDASVDFLVGVNALLLGQLRTVSDSGIRTSLNRLKTYNIGLTESQLIQLTTI